MSRHNRERQKNKKPRPSDRQQPPPVLLDEARVQEFLRHWQTRAKVVMQGHSLGSSQRGVEGNR